MKLFDLKKPTHTEVPILISFPHSGTFIPQPQRSTYRPERLADIDDTDWFLPELYSFASEMGITMIQANYSRWLIDLNRNPEGQALYSDGRLITNLCSTTDFLGNPIYKEGMAPDENEIAFRKKTFFEPYYAAVQSELDRMKAKFGTAILYDSHSIRSQVASIQKDRFPDMVLGTAEGQSCAPLYSEAVQRVLGASAFQLSVNHPFKGGNITRHFGQPADDQHVLQLERCKDLYMKNDEKELDETKANQMTRVLENLFVELINTWKSHGK